MVPGTMGQGHDTSPLYAAFNSFHHGALLGLFSFDTGDALSRMGQPLLQALGFLVLAPHGV